MGGIGRLIGQLLRWEIWGDIERLGGLGRLIASCLAVGDMEISAVGDMGRYRETEA